MISTIPRTSFSRLVSANSNPEILGQRDGRKRQTRKCRISYPRGPRMLHEQQARRAFADSSRQRENIRGRACVRVRTRARVCVGVHAMRSHTQHAALQLTKVARAFEGLTTISTSDLYGCVRVRVHACVCASCSRRRTRGRVCRHSNAVYLRLSCTCER